MKHRQLNRLRAWIGGYFWLPCPLCGQMFGGHEVIRGPYCDIPDARDPSVGHIICPDCCVQRGGYS
jgi:hypothetical protein